VLRRSKVVKTVKCGLVKPGRRTFTYKCTLKRGKYTYRFTAIDLAGNKQAEMKGRTLTVR
jgi:hypothetical protein